MAPEPYDSDRYRHTHLLRVPKVRSPEFALLALHLRGNLLLDFARLSPTSTIEYCRVLAV